MTRRDGFDILIFVGSLGLLGGGLWLVSPAACCVVIGSIGVGLTLYARTRKAKPDEPS